MINILVCEDDSALNSLVCAYLRAAGYQTTSCADGKQGLAGCLHNRRYAALWLACNHLAVCSPLARTANYQLSRLCARRACYAYRHLRRGSRACYGQRKLLYLQVHFKASQGQISRGNFRTFQPYFGRITTAEKSGNTAHPITYPKKALPSLHSTIKPRKKFARFYCFFPLFVL